MKVSQVLLLICVSALVVKSIEIEENQTTSQEEKKVESSEFSAEELAELEKKGEKHEFQAEVGRLMDIIINSLYSQKEVFIRELISNAADALDKIRFQSLSDSSILGEDKELEIKIDYDSDKKTISFQDNGVGMTKEDLKENLGTVAKSGTTQFIEAIKGGNLNLIGQFGVGFYASFLAANKVTVISKHSNDQQYVWESSAANEFQLSLDPRGNTLGRGTRVVLHLKEEATELLQETVLKGHIKKYSEYINFPIKLRILKTTQKEVPIEHKEEENKEDNKEDNKDDELEVKEESEKTEEAKPKTETITEEHWEYEVQNQQKAIWTRSAEDIEEEEYFKFYHSLSHGQEDPACYTHFKTDGGVEFKSILFAPKKAPSGMLENYYKAKSNSLSLYVRRVLISDQFDDLMPKYLQFISGVIDSDDLPLNVNREQLQHSKMLKQIGRKLVKKSLDMMLNFAKGDNEEDEDEEEDKKEGDNKEEDKKEEDKKEEDKKEDKVNTKYLEFFKENGRFLKMGIMEDMANKQKIAKLLRYQSTYNYSQDSVNNNMCSFADYIKRMKKGQHDIYFLGGESLKDIYTNPILAKILARGYEVLMLDETIDEFVFQHLDSYDDRKLINVGKGNFKLPSEDENSEKKMKKLKKMYKPLTSYWEKEFPSLQSVSISDRLDKEPVVIVTSEYGTSATMEKLQKAQAYGMNKEQMMMQAQMNKKILEINPSHPLIKQLLAKVEDKKQDNPEAKLEEDFTDILSLLTQGALIQSGYSLENPLDFQAKLFRNINTLAGVSRDAQVQEVEIDLNEEDEPDDNAQQDQEHKQEVQPEQLNINQDSKDDL